MIEGGFVVHREYEEAMTEVVEILEHTKKEEIEKIPPKFMEYLRKYSSKKYVPNLNHAQKLKDMNLKPMTKALISLIYREYFCDEMQKKEYDKKILEAELQYQEELRKKFKIDDLFKKNK